MKLSKITTFTKKQGREIHALDSTQYTKKNYIYITLQMTKNVYFFSMHISMVTHESTIKSHYQNMEALNKNTNI